ncbi:MAG: YciI family protein [Gemmatirosa sp.]
MRFVVIRKADADTEAGMMPTEALIDAMQRYNEEMVKAGVLLSGAGLKPSAQGARVSFRDGTPTITDGPFAEAKELIAGFSVIEVASRDAALEWLRRWPTLDGGGNVQLELRPLYELEDFGDSPALDRMREVGFIEPWGDG